MLLLRPMIHSRHESTRQQQHETLDVWIQCDQTFCQEKKSPNTVETKAKNGDLLKQFMAKKFGGKHCNYFRQKSGQNFLLITVNLGHF
jgi:hypothetical protein